MDVQCCEKFPELIMNQGPLDFSLQEFFTILKLRISSVIATKFS